ncbi:hypothetical protein [Kitasatospora aureofaciens]|uniref:hypothetical protein n=1 Tax=Kitasatospora aureofaciens TaxID=1894 RepID=UPI001C4422ED|nr:hypothetical protein [Kitasatospora aureofaciens]MBV6703151.1 hypothetical protein [Kitasatospora aureofaciens]
MPKVLEERGGHLPHRDYIACVVAELEALRHGPDTWWLEQAGPADAPALRAVLSWDTGNHNPYADRDVPGADCRLTVAWDNTTGWSYTLEHEAEPGAFPPMELDVPVVSDPAGLARALTYVMTDETAHRMPYPSPWESTEHRAWRSGS